MLETLLVKQMREDTQIAGMLAAYKGKPAFFMQKAPPDTDTGWGKPCYPRCDYNVDTRYNPERKSDGTLSVNVWCTTSSQFMPEDIERRIVELINGTFYTEAGQATVCAVWQRSDAFITDADVSTGVPETLGVTITFDVMMFPAQITSDPDPVWAFNKRTKDMYPEAMVIAWDTLPAIWRPSDDSPAIYWRFAGYAENAQMSSYAVSWYNGSFAAHVIAGSVIERNRWVKSLEEALQIVGEVELADGMPVLIQQISIRHDADPLRDGQIAVTGMYGANAQHRKEAAQIPLNHIITKGGISNG
jgi:hypothetical protein